MNKLLIVGIGIVMFGASGAPAYAEHAVSDASAHRAVVREAEDARVPKLRAFLKRYNSPMEADAAHFISEADRLSLDWKLVAAIAGVESTFGKHVPRNSYNGWGWGIPTGASDGIRFSSWQQGITTVSEGLKYRYIDRGATTIEGMGRIYAASPTWSSKVRFFMQKIDDFEPVGVEHLSVTI